MVKYKQQVQDMLASQQDLFKEFKEIRDKYAVDPKKWQEQFNEVGIKVVPVIQRWENNLCSKSESGKYGKFSSNLADKFWGEIRVHFPKIDWVGFTKKK
jgi:hypothetical protein